MNLATYEALIRREEVEARTGLSRAAIYAAMSRGDFPRSIPLVPGGRSVAWVASEIDRYVRDRIAAARTPALALRSAGSLADWRTNVSAQCRGNSRLIFAVSLGFASMILRRADQESCGFHLHSEPSSGKTTALRVAASVFGAGDYLRRWCSIDDGLSAIAAMHVDALLILDELACVSPKDAGAAFYVLGNRSGCLYLSAGEISLAEHMRQDGKRAQAGQETRLAEIPADAGAGRGLFEQLHGHRDAAAFSRALCANAAQYHGTAAPAFIEGVLRQVGTLADTIKTERATFCAAMLPPRADGQAHRVANRFALVAVAGELATRLGITGWEAGEAEGAARTCFRAWLDARS